MNILSLKLVALIFWIRLSLGQTEFSGKTVEHGEYPFVVSIIIDGSNVRNCLATIISSNWVVTAGTCAGAVGEEGNTYSIEHGAWWANQTRRLTPVIDRINHPQWAGLVSYSTRLLRTKYPMKFDRFTKAVPLIPQPKQVPINMTAFTIAWGSGEDLEVYNSTVLEIRNWNCLYTAPNFVLEEKQTGAPLIYDGYQIGVFVADYPEYNLYSDLSVHLHWIYRTVNFYEFKEEFPYFKNVEPNCTGTPDSNNILDICCKYPFGHDLLELCVALE